MVDAGWHVRYDRAISSMIRDTLTIVEGCFSDTIQRDAIKHLMKKAIYHNMDALRNDFIENFGLPTKEQE